MLQTGAHYSNLWPAMPMIYRSFCIILAAFCTRPFLYMKLSDFHFDLPEELIALYPPAKRTDSRLLCLNRANGELAHRQFPDLLDLIKPEDLMVFNNTRVIPARLFGKKESGGRVEILLERVTDDHTAVAQIKASKSPEAREQNHF